MTPKLVVLPPVNSEDWRRRLAAASREVAVTVCDGVDSAMREIVDADAAFGTVTPELLARATRLRWIQAPAAGPPAGWYYPALVEHPAQVTNFRGIFNDHLSTHIMAFVLAFARGLEVYVHRQAAREWKPGA